jgi:uncharacterized membrane protein
LLSISLLLIGILVVTMYRMRFVLFIDLWKEIHTIFLIYFVYVVTNYLRKNENSYGHIEKNEIEMNDTIFSIHDDDVKEKIH